jgi:hypothetical protein
MFVVLHQHRWWMLLPSPTHSHKIDISVPSRLQRTSNACVAKTMCKVLVVEEDEEICQGQTSRHKPNHARVNITIDVAWVL